MGAQDYVPFPEEVGGERRTVNRGDETGSLHTQKARRDVLGATTERKVVGGRLVKVWVCVQSSRK